MMNIIQTRIIILGTKLHVYMGTSWIQSLEQSRTETKVKVIN